MQYLSQQSPEFFAGKKVLVRLDLNIPSNDQGSIEETDTDRIKKSLPTLQFLEQAGALVMIISHIGRDAHETLAPVAQWMNIPCIREYTDTMFESSRVLMRENLRNDIREEHNDESFARELAAGFDYYVNDAFAVSHRKHASITSIPQILESYVGFQMEQEIKAMRQALDPDHPAVLIMGGAKFETKLPVIHQLLPKVEHVIIGGALANNFLKEQGIDVQNSLIDTNAQLGDLIYHPKIIISDNYVWQESRIVDILMNETIHTIIQNARTIIWNGPMGNYENSFIQGTQELARAIAETSATSIIGGGDSVALIEQLGLADRFSFVSTGGGAMLHYLAQGTLPGIEALENSRNHTLSESPID